MCEKGKCTKNSDDINNQYCTSCIDGYYLENGNWLEGRVFKIDNIIDYLRDFDVVFPITHGKFGEDGKLQGFFDLFDIANNF